MAADGLRPAIVGLAGAADLVAAGAAPTCEVLGTFEPAESFIVPDEAGNVRSGTVAEELDLLIGLIGVGLMIPGVDLVT